MTHSIKHIIGIDGGGTGCRVAIATPDGAVLGKGVGGPANATTDIDAAIRHIKEALAQAGDDAGLADPAIAAAVAHAGIAGVLTKDHAQTIADALPMDTAVTEDAVTSLRGGLGTRDGILIALGTGTLIGQLRKGNQQFIGGWGLVLSDQASAGWLGRSLLSEALLCHDGLAPPSDLLRRALEQFDDDPKVISAFAATASPGDFAEFAPKVTEAAKDGDPVALSLMQTAAIYLTDAIDTLGLDGNEVLCLAGGLGPTYAPWLTPGHRAKLAPVEGTSLDGALALAAERAE